MNALQEEMSGVIPVPGGFGVLPSNGGSSSTTPNHVSEFRSVPGSSLRLSMPKLKYGKRSRSSSTSLFSSSSSSSEIFDDDEFRKKNRARKNFGLKELTPEEYEEIQVEVINLAAQQRMRKDAARQETAMAMQERARKKKR